MTMMTSATSDGTVRDGTNVGGESKLTCFHHRTETMRDEDARPGLLLQERVNVLHKLRFSVSIQSRCLRLV
jgi:hypothetical protein